MKRILAFVAAIGAAGPALARGPDFQGPASAVHKATAPIYLADAGSATQQTKDKKQYTCPMHPEVTSDKPGICPKCGMKLVEKQADNTEADKPHAHDHGKQK